MIVSDSIRSDRVFKKGYLPGWTEEVFILSRVVPGSVVACRIKETGDTPLYRTTICLEWKKR